MCHGMKWQDWELLQDEERREDTEPRVVEVASEPEAFEPEPETEREPERELIRV
jgi:hypothetical protein